MEAWARLSGDSAWDTRNTNLAAAMATLGARIRTDKQIHVVTRARGDITDSQRVTFFMGELPHGTGFTTAKLKALFMSGELEKQHPDHPLLVCLAALNNRERILDWIKKGQRMRLAMAAASRVFMRYIPGEETQAMKLTVRANQRSTRDVKVVAALGVLGIPLLCWDGIAHARTFWCARFGHHLTGGMQHDAESMVKVLADGSLRRTNPEHPLLYAYDALRNRERLLEHVNRDGELLLVRMPNTDRAAYVRADAAGRAHDRATRHLKYGTRA